MWDILLRAMRKIESYIPLVETFILYSARKLKYSMNHCDYEDLEGELLLKFVEAFRQYHVKYALDEIVDYDNDKDNIPRYIMVSLQNHLKHLKREKLQYRDPVELDHPEIFDDIICPYSQIKRKTGTTDVYTDKSGREKVRFHLPDELSVKGLTRGEATLFFCNQVANYTMEELSRKYNMAKSTISDIIQKAKHKMKMNPCNRKFWLKQKV